MKLKDFATINMGQSPKGETYNTDGNGMPFLQGRKTFGRIYPTIDTWTTNPIKIANKDEILMSVRAPVGDMNFANQEICIGRGLCSINAKNSRNKYLYYMLLNSMNDLKQKSTGTVFDSINRNDLENLEINFHSEEEQEKIEKILGSIDSKIELNNEINNNLSEQLKTLFYEWFESKMNDDLPDEWKIVELQEVSTFSQGVQVPIEEQIDQVKNGFVRFIRIVDITQGSEKEIRYIEDRDRGHVVENEIFMTRYGTPGIISRNYNGIIANNLFKISPSNEVTSNYLYSALNVDRIQSYIRGNATSSTMPAISFSTLNNQKIIIPDNKMLEKFDKYSETIRIKQLNIINENKKLEQLRDTLLPKLMNGEIDLDNIEI